MSLASTLLRSLRNPIVHVAVLGCALFALHRALAPPRDPREITVTDALLRALRQDHLRRTGSPPTSVEAAALLDRWVDDEVQFREALRLGLDRGDVVVRRRLIQKMAFLTEDREPVREPTDAELAAYLAAHPARWAEPERVTFEHVFASRERHGDDADPTAAGWRDALAAGADPATMGEPFLRGREFILQGEAQLAAVFGAGFARAVVALPVGVWSGPLRSSYGSHLVRLRARQPARLPALAAVRDAVRRDWAAAERERLDRDALGRLRAAYTVRHDPAETGTAQAADGP